MISPRRLSARIDCILSLKRCARRLAVAQLIRKTPRALTSEKDGETDERTLFKHTFFNILALSEIDERFDKRETADDLLTQRIKFRPRVSLQPNKSKPRMGIA